MESILFPFKERYLSPQEYANSIKKDGVRRNIESIQFIPPKVGGKGYGKFKVRYKTPVLK